MNLARRVEFGAVRALGPTARRAAAICAVACGSRAGRASGPQTTELRPSELICSQRIDDTPPVGPAVSSVACALSKRQLGTWLGQNKNLTREPSAIAIVIVTENATAEATYFRKHRHKIAPFQTNARKGTHAAKSVNEQVAAKQAKTKRRLASRRAAIAKGKSSGRISNWSAGFCAAAATAVVPVKRLATRSAGPQ